MAYIKFGEACARIDHYVRVFFAFLRVEFLQLFPFPVYLEKGIHSLLLEYFDSGEDAVEQLYWSTPTMAEEIIPAGPLQPPYRANTSNPLNGSVDVTQTPILTWNAGEAAVSHEVYFGIDADAVKSADSSSPEYKGSRDLGNESFDPGQLEWDTAYYCVSMRLMTPIPTTRGQVTSGALRPRTS